jgi:8-oxo-dGTP pyrophosphatase MutT (NUDIX family)
MYIRLLYLGYKIYCFLFRPVRVGVRTLMTDNDKVWLIRHTYLKGWFMPGGGLKRNESLEQAARREAREETGAELGLITLMGVYTSYIDWKTDHAVVFMCNEFSFHGKPDGEIAELRSFPLNALPDDMFPSHRLRLEEYQKGIPQPQFGEW